MRGHGYLAVSKRHHVSVGAVRDIVKRAKANRKKLRTAWGHRPRKLTTAETRKLQRYALAHPDSTARELARLVGNKIHPNTVYLYLARYNPPIVQLTYDDYEPELDTERWKEEGREYHRRIQRVAKKDMVFEDETAVFSNEAKKKGWGLQGQKLRRPRTRYGVKKYTLHTFAR